MATSNNNYFKLYRSIFENELLNEKPFDPFHAWVWLLGRANYADATRRYRGQLQTIRRGQVCTSYGELAEVWGWSVNKVRRFIRQLTRQGMVHADGTPNGTTLTLENYAFYQDGRHTNRHTDGITLGTPDGTPDGSHYKKNKEEIRKEEGRRRSASAPTSSDDEMVPTDPDEQAAYLDELFDKLGIGKEADE